MPAIGLIMQFGKYFMHNTEFTRPLFSRVTPNLLIHSVNIRKKGKLTIPSYRTVLFKHSFT